MSYTSIDRVRCYLTSDYAQSNQVTDHAVTLHGTNTVTVWGCALLPDSLRVKSDQASAPVRLTMTVAADGMVLTSSPLLRGSVVVASDSSLGRIYVENLDYIVDYVQSSVTPKTNGALEIGQVISVWFVPMHRYIAGVDYSIDYERAALRRLTSGAIAPGETVYLDFAPVFTGFDDELLAVAVHEANGMIEREIDPERQFGADESLMAAATSVAMEIICYAAASRELSNGRGLDRIAAAWLKLAESHRERSSGLLKSFRPPAIGPTAPALS